MMAQLRIDFQRRRKVETFPWARVELMGDGVQLALGVAGQVCSLGHVLAQQAVRVLVGPALPGTADSVVIRVDAASRTALIVVRHLGLIGCRSASADGDRTLYLGSKNRHAHPNSGRGTKSAGCSSIMRMERPNGSAAQHHKLSDCNLAAVRLSVWLGSGGLEGSNLFRDSSWQIHKDKVGFVIEIVLAALIHNSHQIILGRLLIRDDSIHLAGNQRSFIIGIIHAEGE